LSARVINNTEIAADYSGSGGATGPFVVETAGNDNDWDGTTGTGRLEAHNGNVLEIRDNDVVLFTGTVDASFGATIFAKGFEMLFGPGSTLSLTSNSRYRSTHRTDIQGTVTVSGGSATLELAGEVVFRSGSNTTLTGNLRLDNAATRVSAGATLALGILGSYVPAVGQTIDILSAAGGVSGRFASVGHLGGMPVGLIFNVLCSPDAGAASRGQPNTWRLQPQRRS
jgi:hypothetical protein